MVIIFPDYDVARIAADDSSYLLRLAAAAQRASSYKSLLFSDPIGTLRDLEGEKRAGDYIERFGGEARAGEAIQRLAQAAESLDGLKNTTPLADYAKLVLTYRAYASKGGSMAEEAQKLLEQEEKPNAGVGGAQSAMTVLDQELFGKAEEPKQASQTRNPFDANPLLKKVAQERENAKPAVGAPVDISSRAHYLRDLPQVVVGIRPARWSQKNVDAIASCAKEAAEKGFEVLWGSNRRRVDHPRNNWVNRTVAITFLVSGNFIVRFPPDRPKPLVLDVEMPGTETYRSDD
jgi:hypothetical protein